MKIHTGDSIIVISWKDKGKKWKITRALPWEHQVVVEGVGIVTKHMKPQGGQAGQIVKFEKPIDVSRVMLIDPKDGTPTRVGYTFVDGKKTRIAKRSRTTL